MLPKKWFLLAALMWLIVPFSSLAAQDQPTISIALPTNMKSIVNNGLFSNFESANNVNVYVNYADAEIPAISDGVDAYLDAVASYVSSADVLYIDGAEFDPAATRAGYFLDLSPLTSADSSLNSDDFVPAAWQSVQWDGGVWALPVSVDVSALIYDPDAFDKAGLAYPNDRWTIDDLANAAKALTQYDSSGAVSVAGLATVGDTSALFRSLYGKNFFDDNGNPQLTDPALEALLTQWQDLMSSGYVSKNFASGANQPPMRIMPSSIGLRFPRSANAAAPVAVALPGGGVGLSVTAFAVSSGTQQPELAYALAEYLSNNADFANGPFGGIAARTSVQNAQPTRQPGFNAGSTGAAGNGGGVSLTQSGGSSGGGAPPGGGGGGFFIGGGNSAGIQAEINQLLPKALPVSDVAFADYLDSALNAMTSQGIDAHTALQDAETQASSDLQTAADRKATVNVVVATPPPPVVLQPGQIALNFGIQSNIQPIPNLDQWQQLAKDFSSGDSDVGEVNFDTGNGGPSGPGDVSQLAQKDDCFYLNSNAVPSLDESTVMNLDPYLDADPNFDPNDVLNGIMQQLTKDNHVWAYPLTITPQTLSYDADIFQKAGVPAPTNGWTVSQFTDALQTLKTYLNTAPFVPHDLNNESLMMLIAAYGGLPIDYRTDPPTYDFTDPATVSAIQQVLDLAKNGYMTYQASSSGAGGFRIVTINGAEQDAITNSALAGFQQVRRAVPAPNGGGSDGKQNPYLLVNYPSGTYDGVSYTIGTGYISATAQDPDACYRWLSYVAQHIDVFSAMPARLSQINDPTMQQNFGGNASFYASYAQMLQSPNAIIFPSAEGGNSSISDFVIQYWLNHAFDDYVQNNGDLASDLSDAQTYATAFQQCVAALPPADQTGGGGGRGLNASIRDCATQADPSTSNLFPQGNG